MEQKYKIAFFGTPRFSVAILEELKHAGIVPALIVTNEDEPKGRHLTLTPPPAKMWAESNGVSFIQPHNLKTIPEELKAGFDLFIVAAYGKIIPQTILDLPRRGTLNIHPSLLPKYRGASPLQSSILGGDKETGVTIMLLDAEMDHGPIVAQETVMLTEPLPYTEDLSQLLAKKGGSLLAKIIPDWIESKTTAREQDHAAATYTKKFGKDDGFIEPAVLFDSNMTAETATQIERKVRALSSDPGVYTFIEKGGRKMRVKIIRAKLTDNKLVIEKVIPEGKKEMAWEEFKRGYLKK